MKLIKWLKKLNRHGLLALITTGFIVWQFPKMSLSEDIMWTLIVFIAYYQSWKWALGGYDMVQTLKPEYRQHEEEQKLNDRSQNNTASELVFSQDTQALSRLLEKEMNGD